MSQRSQDHEKKSTERAEPQSDSCGVSVAQNQALHMWDTVVKLGLSEDTMVVGPEFILGT